MTTLDFGKSPKRNSDQMQVKTSSKEILKSDLLPPNEVAVELKDNVS